MDHHTEARTTMIVAQKFVPTTFLDTLKYRSSPLINWQPSWFLPYLYETRSTEWNAPRTLTFGRRAKVNGGSLLLDLTWSIKRKGYTWREEPPSRHGINRLVWHPSLLRTLICRPKFLTRKFTYSYIARLVVSAQSQPKTEWRTAILMTRI